MILADYPVTTLSSIDGAAFGGVVISPDSYRAYQITVPVFVQVDGLGDLWPIPEAAGPDQSWVSVIHPDNTVTTLPPIRGTLASHIVISPDATRAYYTSEVVDAVNHSTHVSVIDLEKTLTTLPPIEGSPASGVVVCPDGTRAYQTTEIETASGVHQTSVSLIHADNTITTLPPIEGSPLGGGVVVSPDGTRAYQTTEIETASGVHQTSVSLIHADNTITTLAPIEGRPLNAVVVSPDGTRAYQTTDTGSGVYQTSVSLIHADNTITTLPPIEGRPLDALVVSPDGTRAYLTIETFDFDTDRWPTPTGTSVLVIEPDNVVTTLPLDGDATGGVVVSPDCMRAYQTIQTATETLVLVISPDNTFTTLSLDGDATGGVVVSPDGDQVFQTTALLDSVTDHYSGTLVSVISADNTVTTLPPIAGRPPYEPPGRTFSTEWQAGVVISPDGTHAYQSTVTDTKTPIGGWTITGTLVSVISIAATSNRQKS